MIRGLFKLIKWGLVAFGLLFVLMIFSIGRDVNKRVDQKKAENAIVAQPVPTERLPVEPHNAIVAQQDPRDEPEDIPDTEPAVAQGKPEAKSDDVGSIDKIPMSKKKAIYAYHHERAMLVSYEAEARWPFNQIYSPDNSPETIKALSEQHENFYKAGKAKVEAATRRKFQINGKQLQAILEYGTYQRWAVDPPNPFKQ